MKAANNSQKHEEKTAYKVPTITTYTAEELLAIVGPVHAGSNPGDNDPMGGGLGTIEPLHKILKVV